MAAKTILVAAPRKTPWDPTDPKSVTILYQKGRLHPANPAYATGPGWVCIDEGHGVMGDPGRANNPAGSPPVEVYPYPEIMDLIREQLLVQVPSAKTDTSNLNMSEDDLHSLGLTDNQIKQLIGKGISTVGDLGRRLQSAEDPGQFLADVKFFREATVVDVLDQLAARQLIDPRYAPGLV